MTPEVNPVNLEVDAQAPQWRRVASSSELRVGDLVRWRIDPQNEAWLDSGIRAGSVGVVAWVPDTPPRLHAGVKADTVGVRYFDAPTTPEWYTANYWKSSVCNLEVLDV